jgi:hypothetical protein
MPHRPAMSLTIIIILYNIINNIINSKVKIMNYVADL